MRYYFVIMGNKNSLSLSFLCVYIPFLINDLCCSDLSYGSVIWNTMYGFSEK